MSEPQNQPVKLEFAQSSSAVVGFKGRAVEYLRVNADRVFGAINVAADSALLAAAAIKWQETPIGEIIAPALFILGSVPMALSRNENKIEEVFEPQKPWVDRIAEKALRTLNPKNHPVEVFSLPTGIGGAVFTAQGTQLFIENPNFANASMAIFGLLTSLVSALQVFAPSKSEIDYENSKSLKIAHNKVVDYARKNPEKIVSLAERASSIALAGSGIASGNHTYTICGAALFVSYAIYGQFVNREAAPTTERQL